MFFWRWPTDEGTHERSNVGKKEKSWREAEEELQELESLQKRHRWSRGRAPKTGRGMCVHILYAGCEDSAVAGRVGSEQGRRATERHVCTA